jgi:hypothetical protein
MRYTLLLTSAVCVAGAIAIEGAGKVFVTSKDEGRYENGKWIAGRRINGDELFESSLPKTKVGMLKVKLVRLQ